MVAAERVVLAWPVEGAGTSAVAGESDSLVVSPLGAECLLSSLAILTGVAGIDSGFSSITSSVMTGSGEVGRVAVGVESAVLRGFFVFFLRPTMGACSGSSAIGFSGTASALVASSTCFARACLSFFCWDLETCLTGAVSTLLGGGELARDSDVEVSDALSEILSLIGVPGACTEAKLGRRDNGLLVTADDGSVTVGEGNAGLGTVSLWVDGATREVRGCGRLVVDTADCGAALVGVLG